MFHSVHTFAQSMPLWILHCKQNSYIFFCFVRRGRCQGLNLGFYSCELCALLLSHIARILTSEFSPFKDTILFWSKYRSKHSDNSVTTCIKHELVFRKKNLKPSRNSIFCTLHLLDFHLVPQGCPETNVGLAKLIKMRSLGGFSWLVPFHYTVNPCGPVSQM